MEGNLLVSVFVFIAAALVVVPAAKMTGFGSVLGYLVAGVLIGPYALRFVSDPETILHFSEFGVVMMLFLIGLEMQPRELWRLRSRLIGMGGVQFFMTALAIFAIALVAGIAWQSALITGMALALSSTAIVLQIMAERAITQTDTGRSTFSVLLFQDIAVIPILALIPLLALSDLHPAILAAEGRFASAAAEEPGWMLALRTLVGFLGMYLAGRYILRPVMSLVARLGIREIFTALALFVVVGSALLMEWMGLAHALGAFFAGVVLADSEYRHELESDIEPFKGLLLGLFFISVGMSIEFSVLMQAPLIVVEIVLGLVVVKFAVLYAIGSAFRLHLTDRFLFATLLAQGGEFAFVLFQVAHASGALAKPVADILNVSVALSMAMTPVLLLAFERFVAPRLSPAKSEADLPDIDGHAEKVLVLGYGRFGQIIARLLHAQGFETTLIDHDPAKGALLGRFGWKVFYGDVGRLDLLRAAGAEDARLIVVTIKDREKSIEICRMIQRHFPKARIYARAYDRVHAYELMDLGVDGFERETFRSSLALAAKVLVGLGYSAHGAQRVAKSFEWHDTELLESSRALRNDDEAYVSYINEARETLHSVMRVEREEQEQVEAASWPAEADDIDKEAQARSE
ncbi:MAG: monovalent cation:proton antiporter-2 (CPA2) family protein [Alphaproteobacteria bacterium]|nr:monovalent cation:proton antiporter-2 (CPA2) family protein [Alphaproteobacteria bacterium]